MFESSREHNRVWRKIVLITLGEKGSFVYLQDQQEAYVSGYSSKVVDTTGAGDSFMGGFYIRFVNPVSV